MASFARAIAPRLFCIPRRSWPACGRGWSVLQRADVFDVMEGRLRWRSHVAKEHTKQSHRWEAARSRHAMNALQNFGVGSCNVLQAPVARRASPQVLQARCGAITLFKVGPLNAFAWRDLHVAHALTVQGSNRGSGSLPRFLNTLFPKRSETRGLFCVCFGFLVLQLLDDLSCSISRRQCTRSF